MQLCAKKKKESTQCNKALTLFSPCVFAVARDFSVCIFSKTKFTFLFVTSSLSLLLHAGEKLNITVKQKVLVKHLFSCRIRSWNPGCWRRKAVQSQLSRGREGFIALWCVTSQNNKLHYSIKWTVRQHEFFIFFLLYKGECYFVSAEGKLMGTNQKYSIKSSSTLT